MGFFGGLGFRVWVFLGLGFGFFLGLGFGFFWGFRVQGLGFEVCCMGRGIRTEG